MKEGSWAAKAVEHAWMLTNLAGYCFLPTSGLSFSTFNKAYLRQFGIESDVLEKEVCYKDSFNDTVYSRAIKPRIPLRTHRMWLTNPVDS